MAPQKQTPTSGQTLAGATRFQQSEQILSLALIRLGAIFSMGEWVSPFAVVLALVAVEVTR